MQIHQNCTKSTIVQKLHAWNITAETVEHNQQQKINLISGSSNYYVIGSESSDHFVLFYCGKEPWYYTCTSLETN